VPVVLDTDVAIHLRDGDPDVRERLDRLGKAPVVSAVTVAELHGGVAADGSTGAVRSRLLDELLRFVPVLPFTADEARAYGEIVRAGRHDRRRVLDRMIAAQAIAAGLRLVTMNGRDFRDIAGLELEIWPAPTPRPPSSAPR
jgi:predicted nucleic acid-binding protein